MIALPSLIIRWSTAGESYSQTSRVQNKLRNALFHSILLLVSTGKALVRWRRFRPMRHKPLLP
jgi:hypothetical protein